MSHFALLWKARAIEQYRRQYEKEKLLSLEAGNIELPRRTLCQKARHVRVRFKKRIKTLFRSCCPEDSSLSHLLLYLRTDQTFPNFLLKSVLGFVGGIVLTYILFMFLVFQLSISLAHATAMCSLVGVMLTLGLAFSYRVRCLVFLLLPQLFSEVGRYTLLGYALILILTGPAKNTLHNSEVLSESMACGQEQLKSSVRQIQESISRPFHSMRDTIQLMVDSVKEVAKNIKESLMAINRMVLSIVQALQAPLSWLASIAAMCNKKVGSPSERCHRALDDGVLDCRARLGPYFSWLCNVTYVAKAACEAAKVMDYMCVLVDFVGNTVVATIKRKLRTFSNHVKTMLFVSVHIHHTYSFSTNSSRSASQVAAGIVTEIRHRADRLLQWFSWMSCITSLFLLLIIFRAKYYQHMYESRVRYDNRYITRELRELDLRRARESRDTVLPLNRRERADCVTTTSLRLVASERLSLARSAVFLAVTTFKLLVHMAADYSLYWVLVTIRYHGRFERPPLPAAPDGGVVVSGKGALAGMLRALAAALAAPLAARPPAAPVSCLPDPSPPDTQRYMQIAFLVVLLWLFALLQPYGLRLRHVVMDHYRPERARARAVWLYNHILRKRAFLVVLLWLFTLLQPYGLRLRHVVMDHYRPERARARTVWLYNHILRNRGGFLKMARRKLHRDFKIEEQVKDHFTFKQWLDSIIPCWWLRACLRTGGGDERCVLCGVTATPTLPDSQLIRCETEGCAGVYCASCYDDIGRLCTACLAPADYGDLSDISLEKGSSKESSPGTTTTEAESEIEEEEYVNTPEWRSASEDGDDDTSPSTKRTIMKLRDNMKGREQSGERQQPKSEAKNESPKSKSWKRFFKKRQNMKSDFKDGIEKPNGFKNKSVITKTEILTEKNLRRHKTTINKETVVYSLSRSTSDKQNVFCLTKNNTSSDSSDSDDSFCDCKPKRRNFLRKLISQKVNSHNKSIDDSEDSTCRIENEQRSAYKKHQKHKLKENNTKMQKKGIHKKIYNKIHDSYSKKKVKDSDDDCKDICCDDSDDGLNTTHNRIRKTYSCDAKANTVKKSSKSEYKQSEEKKYRHKHDSIESDDNCRTESEDDLYNLVECECEEETHSVKSEKHSGVQTFEKWHDIKTIQCPFQTKYNEKLIIKLKDRKVQTTVNMNDVKTKGKSCKCNLSEKYSSENIYRKRSTDITSRVKSRNDHTVNSKKNVKTIESSDFEENDDCLRNLHSKNPIFGRIKNNSKAKHTKHNDSKVRLNKSKTKKRFINLRRKSKKYIKYPHDYYYTPEVSPKRCRTKNVSKSSSCSSLIILEKHVDKSVGNDSCAAPQYPFNKMQDFNTNTNPTHECQCNYWDIISKLKTKMCNNIEGLLNNKLNGFFWGCNNPHNESLMGQCQQFSRNYDCRVFNQCPSDQTSVCRSSVDSHVSKSLPLSKLNPPKKQENNTNIRIDTKFDKCNVRKSIRQTYRASRIQRNKDLQSTRKIRRRNCLSTRKFRRKSCRKTSMLVWRDERYHPSRSKFTNGNQMVFMSMPSILKHENEFKKTRPKYNWKIPQKVPITRKTHKVKKSITNKKNWYSEIYANEMGFDPIDESESIKSLILAYNKLDKQAAKQAKNNRNISQQYSKPSESPVGPWAAEYKWPTHLEKPPCRCPLERCTCKHRKPPTGDATSDLTDEELPLQKRNLDPVEHVKTKWSFRGLYDSIVSRLKRRGFWRGGSERPALAGQGDLLPLLDRALRREKMRYRDKDKTRHDCLARCHKFYREPKSDATTLDYSYQDRFDELYQLENERRFHTMVQKGELRKKIMSGRGANRVTTRSNDEASLQDLMDDLLSDGRTLGSTQSLVSPDENIDTIIDIEPATERKKHAVKFSDVNPKYYTGNERFAGDVKIELVRPCQSAGQREFKWLKFATLDDVNSPKTSKVPPIKVLNLDDLKCGAAEVVERVQRCASKALQLRKRKAIGVRARPLAVDYPSPAAAQAVSSLGSAHAVDFHASTKAVGDRAPAPVATRRSTSSGESVESARRRRGEGGSVVTEREAIQKELERDEWPAASLSEGDVEETTSLQRKTYEQSMGEEGQHIVDALWKDSVAYNLGIKCNHPHGNTSSYTHNMPHEKLKNASVQCKECSFCKRHRQQRQKSVINNAAVQCPSVTKFNRLRRNYTYKPRNVYKRKRTIGIGTDNEFETQDVAIKTHTNMKKSKEHPNITERKHNVKQESPKANQYTLENELKSDPNSPEHRRKFHGLLKINDTANTSQFKHKKHVKINETPRIFQDEHQIELEIEDTHKYNQCKYHSEYNSEDYSSINKCKHQKYVNDNNAPRINSRPKEIDFYETSKKYQSKLQSDSKFEDTPCMNRYKHRKQVNMDDTPEIYQHRHQEELKTCDIAEKGHCKHTREAEIKDQMLNEIDEYDKYYQITDRGALYQKKRKRYKSRKIADGRNEKKEDITSGYLEPDRVHREIRIRQNRNEPKSQSKTHSALKAMRRIILPDKDLECQDQDILARGFNDARRRAHIDRILQPIKKDGLVTLYQAKIDSSAPQYNRNSTSFQPEVEETACGENNSVSGNISFGPESSNENIFFNDKFEPTKTSSPTENDGKLKENAITTADISPIAHHSNCGFFKILHESSASDKPEELHNQQKNVSRELKFERSSTESQQRDKARHLVSARTASNSSRTRNRKPNPTISKTSPQKLRRRIRKLFKNATFYSFIKGKVFNNTRPSACSLESETSKTG